MFILIFADLNDRYGSVPANNVFRARSSHDYHSPRWPWTWVLHVSKGPQRHELRDGFHPWGFDTAAEWWQACEGEEERGEVVVTKLLRNGLCQTPLQATPPPFLGHHFSSFWYSNLISRTALLIVIFNHLQQWLFLIVLSQLFLLL